MNVTSIEQLKNIAKGQVVEILGWGKNLLFAGLKDLHC